MPNEMCLPFYLLIKFMLLVHHVGPSAEVHPELRCQVEEEYLVLCATWFWEMRGRIMISFGVWNR